MIVNVGFIGVGGMAEVHIRALQKIEHAKLAAVYDINQERAKEVAEQYGMDYYDSEQALLASGVDAIFICTPPFVRSTTERAAAKLGIHVLSEKPVDLNVEQARETERILNESGVMHSSGYCLRYLDTVEQAKAYLADKKIDLIMAYRMGSLPPPKWWRMQEQSGGQLVEQSTHQLDLVRYLAGELKEVHAYHEQRHLKNVDPEATAYDVGTVSFVMESGAIGNITSTCLARFVGRSAVEFYGTDFYLAIEGTTLRIVDETQDITVKSFTDFYLEQDRAFIEAIRTGNRALIRCDYSEAVLTLAASLAANDSADQQQTVTL